MNTINCCEKCLSYELSDISEDSGSVQIPVCANVRCECHMKLTR